LRSFCSREVLGFGGPGRLLKSSGSEVLGFGGPGRLLKSSGSFDLPIMAQG
jgi:hypothetical protein